MKLEPVALSAHMTDAQIYAGLFECDALERVGYSEEMLQVVRRLIDSAIPDGYVVVPVEISGKMWSAGRDALREVIDAYEEAQGYELRSAILDRGPEKVHEAMLAAKEQS